MQVSREGLWLEGQWLADGWGFEVAVEVVLVIYGRPALGGILGSFAWAGLVGADYLFLRAAKPIMCQPLLVHFLYKLPEATLDNNV